MDKVGAWRSPPEEHRDDDLEGQPSDSGSEATRVADAMTSRVGMVGYGWAAGAHLAALASDPGRRGRGDLHVAVGRRQPSGRGDPDRPIEIVRDFEELLARDDIDVIDICSRSDLHAAQAIAAAQAGKHLIIEKPIALSLRELRALERAVADAGVRTCVCFEERYSSQFTATRSMIERDLIGPLHYGEVDYYHEVGPSVRQYEWNRLRVGGGSSLLSCGCHAVDGLLLFMGSSAGRGHRATRRARRTRCSPGTSTRPHR